MISLDEFINDTKIELDNFRDYWIREREKNPEYYPLELGEENAGLWFEMFSMWDGDEEEDK